jgi:hypothetical protein
MNSGATDKDPISREDEPRDAKPRRRRSGGGAGSPRDPDRAQTDPDRACAAASRSVAYAVA